MDRPKIVRQVEPGLLPWRAEDRIVYDANDVSIGMLDTPKIANFLVACVNYIWETDDS